MTFISVAKRFAALLTFAALLGFSALATAVTSPPFVQLTYSPSSITQGGVASLVVQIMDTSGAGFTSGQTSSPITYFTGTGTAGVSNTGNVISNDCGGIGFTLTANAAQGQFGVTGVDLGASASCFIYIEVTTSAPGTYTTGYPGGVPFTATTGTSNNSVSTTLTSVAPTVVTNTNDSGAGSLRDAINIANGGGSCLASSTSITFAIAPGTGPFTIQPATQLPAIACPNTFIDGYTQSGSSPNGDTSGGNNASIQVVLDGSACSACDGLQIQASNVIVKGLAIRSFGGSGILVASGAATILGNYIGTDPGGMNAFGNAAAGVQVTGGTLQLGGSSAADRNLISANGVGVSVSAGATASITNNQIGGKRDGSAGNGNAAEGIRFTGVNFCCNYISDNFVHENGAAGILLDAGTTGRVVLSANMSYANAGIGIDIKGDGASLNDETSPPYDTDGVQNYPVVTSVAHAGGNTVVTGYLKSVASSFSPYPVTIELYHNSVSRSQTEGEQFIDSFNASLDTTGVISFTRTIAGSWNNVSAATTVDTCGDGCVRSSEYSPSVAVTDPLVVVNTKDSGAGSLRDAINFVDANCAAQTITFNIPGSGIQTISPATALPAISCPGTAIDGFTQPGAHANLAGDDAVRLIEINGGLAGIANGLEVRAGGVTIRGLIIDNFQQLAAILVDAFSGSSGIQILGNVLGDPTGTRARKNSIGVQDSMSIPALGLAAKRRAISGKGTGPQRLMVGGGSLGDRNVISGNDIGVWIKASDSAVIQNNYIGTNVSGTGASGNDTGITTSSGVGSVAIAGNVVAGNINDGIKFVGGSPILVQGNFIGTNAAGATGLGNAFAGVNVQASGAQVGGPSPGNGNVIAFNGASAVQVQTTGVSIRGNSIYQNTGLGIDLVGQTPAAGQDHCDADAGSNNGQNYPVITTASLGGGNLTVTGTFDSVDLVTYQLDLFSNLAADNASNTAGRAYIGSTPVVTSFPGTCSTPWSVSFPYAGAVGDLITSTATDPAGNTSWFSVAVPVTVATTAPGAPTIGPASPGDAQATVAFSPPASDGGSPITSYTVTSSPGGVTATGTASAILVTALTNGTTYTFTVTATNAVGTGAPSAPSNAVTPNVVPGAPIMGSATPGNGQATVSFTPPAGNGGTAILDYTVTSSPSGFTATGTASPITVTGLVNATSYTFTVTARNAQGSSLPSASSNTVTPTAPPGSPGAPLGVSATAGNAQATVSFSPPASNGGSAITTYTVTSNPSGITATGSASPITVSGLVNGTAYTFTVVATNGVGPGPASAPSNSVTPLSAPGAPIMGSASAGVSQATVSFSPPASNGGSAITSYTVTSNPGGITATGTASPITVTGLTNGTTYTFKVSATNAVGTGPLSAASNAVTPSAPSLTLTPSSLTFPTRTVSTTSPAQTVTLTNNGSVPIVISSITVSGDFAFTSTCGASLAAGATCTLSVTFTPLIAGARTGAVTITSTASGSPHGVALAGTGQDASAPILQVSPTAGAFAAQEVGTTSAPDLFVITNVGNATLVFGDISVTGAGFTLLSTITGSTYTRCGPSIVSGAVCAVQVTFTASVPGAASGNLHIAGNATNSPVDVSLVASGVITVPARALTVPASLAFPDQPVGTQSAGRGVPLTNNLASVVSVSGLATDGDFSVSDTCTTIAGHGTCTPLVTFHPAAVGSRTGHLTIHTLSEAVPYVVDLSGTGTFNPVPQIELSVTRLGFGNTLMGVPVSAQVVIRNVGQVPVTIQSVTATGDFFVGQSCGVTIAVAGSCTLNVSFFPRMTGGRLGGVEIRTNASGSPHEVQVSGVGCALPSFALARLATLLCGP